MKGQRWAGARFDLDCFRVYSFLNPTLASGPGDGLRSGWGGGVTGFLFPSSQCDHTEKSPLSAF